MDEIFGIPAPLLFGQLLLGLINGAFYAMLSLGLAVIFGLLRVINFAHGEIYMIGAFTALIVASALGIMGFPAAGIIEWAQARSARLLLLDDSHRLSAHVDATARAFAELLQSL